MSLTDAKKTSDIHSLQDVEESLRQIPNSDFAELKSFAKPPLSCLFVFEAIGILLDPSKRTWEWTDDKKLMSGNKNQFLQKIFNIDKSSISNEQIQRIQKVLNQDECQIDALRNVSRLCAELCLWLRIVIGHASNQN